MAANSVQPIQYTLPSVTHADGFYLNDSAVEDVVDEDGLQDELASVVVEHHATVASLHPRHQQLPVDVRQRLVAVVQLLIIIIIIIIDIFKVD